MLSFSEFSATNAVCKLACTTEPCGVAASTLFGTTKAPSKVVVLVLLVVEDEVLVVLELVEEELVLVELLIVIVVLVVEDIVELEDV